MGTLDIILLLIFIPGIILGFAKGFVIQLVSLASLFISAIVAGRFSGPASEWVTAHLDWGETPAKIVCYALVFIVCALLLSLAAKLVTKLVSAASLGWLNRLAGVLFSVVVTALLLGLIISLAEGLAGAGVFKMPAEASESAVYNSLRDFACNVLPMLKNIFVSKCTPV